MGGGNGQKSKMDRERKLEKMKSSKGSQLESNKKAMNIQMASEDRGVDQPSRMGPSGVRPDQTQDPHTSSSSYSLAETTLFYPSQPPPSCYPAQPPPSHYPAQPSPSNYPAQPPPYSGQPQYYPPLPTDYYPHPQPTYFTPPPPNTQAGPSTAPAAQTDIEGGIDSNKRIMIEPDRDTFYSSIHVTHHITNIIKSMFDGPYYSWTRIPLNIREIWFREFMRYFVWLPEHTDHIRRNFERRCAYRLRDMFTDIRKTLQKPVWIRDDIWSQLLSEWERPECVQMREKNKRNRASQGEGSSSQPSDFDTWREAAGGKNKGRIYGLGTVAYTSSSHSSYSMDSSRSISETIRRYEEQIREQNQQIRELTQQLMEQNQQIRELTQQLMEQNEQIRKQNHQNRELQEEMTRQGEEYRRELRRMKKKKQVATFDTEEGGGKQVEDDDESTD